MFLLTIVCLLGSVPWNVHKMGGQTLLHFSKCVSYASNLYWLTSLMYGQLYDYTFHVTKVIPCMYVQVGLSNWYVCVCVCVNCVNLVS